MLYIFYSSTLTRWAISNPNFILVFFQSAVTTLELQYSSLILEAAKLTDSQQTNNFTAYDEETLVDRTVIGGIRQGNYPQEPTSPNMHDNDR